MNKRQNKKSSLFLAALLVMALFLAACGTATGTASAAETKPATVGETAELVEEVAQSVEIQETTVDDDPIGSEPAPIVQEAPVSGGNEQNGPGQGIHITPQGDLGDDEIAALLYMREEEKLARDVYLAMYDVWGVPIFANIAGSEQAHMDAVANLIQAYGLQDPAAGKAAGQFENEDLQALYNQLLTQGQQSLEAALLVGGAIEEIDILDLQERLAQTNNEAIIQVYQNLLAGSVNHLGAFSMNLERQTGNAYQLQYMSQGAYEALLGEASGRGTGAGGSNGGGQGNNDGAGSSGQGNGGNGRGQGNSSSDGGQGQGNSGNGQGKGNGRQGQGNGGGQNTQ